MRIRSLVIILLLVALTASLTACGGSKLPEAGGLDPLKPGLNVETAEPAVPTDTAAPAAPAVMGADSVRTLIEKSLEYFRSGCDYKKIADVHDRQAYLGWFLMEDLYRDRDMSLAEATEKAALLFEDAETLQTRDPELAALVLEETDAEEPDEYLNDYMSELRDAIRSGELTEDDPNYEKLSAMLGDWDKGADYVFEHYPELLERAEERNQAIGLEGALRLMQKFARFELYNGDLQRFRELETEYRPENTYVDASGICSYDLGKVEDGNDVWMVDMMYYVKDGTYFLIGYSVAVGSKGG